MLDVGKDEHLELHRKIAKAGVQVDHLAAIRTATRGWVVTTALRRWGEKFPRKKRSEFDVLPGGGGEGSVHRDVGRRGIDGCFLGRNEPT